MFHLQQSCSHHIYMHTPCTYVCITEGTFYLDLSAGISYYSTTMTLPHCLLAFATLAALTWAQQYSTNTIYTGSTCQDGGSTLFRVGVQNHTCTPEPCKAVSYHGQNFSVAHNCTDLPETAGLDLVAFWSLTSNLSECGPSHPSAYPLPRPPGWPL